MGRLGLGALVALGVACGGRAEQSATTTGGNVDAGTGGGGVAGEGSSGGQPAMGGTSIGSQPGIGGTSIGVGGSTPAAGEQLTCDHGTLNYFPFPFPYAGSVMPAGFVGSFNGSPLELESASPHDIPVPGTISGEASGCISSRTFRIRLNFDTPHDGEQLYFNVEKNPGCLIAAGYLLDRTYMVPVAVEIDVKLEAWYPDIQDPADAFMQGEFTATVAEPLGHSVSGAFSLTSDHAECLL